MLQPHLRLHRCNIIRHPGEKSGCWGHPSASAWWEAVIPIKLCEVRFFEDWHEIRENVPGALTPQLNALPMYVCPAMLFGILTSCRSLLWGDGYFPFFLMQWRLNF